MDLSGQETDVRGRDGNNNGNPLFNYTPKVVKTSFTGGSNSKTSIVRYRECLRNHAASVGGNVFDGCGEFMPGGEEGTIEALKCAACDCHRNFHRKEINGESSNFTANSRRCIVPTLQLPAPFPSPTLLHHQKYIHANPIQSMNLGFAGGGGGNESSTEDLNHNVFHSNVEGISPPAFGLSKKRFRTKFTAEQKEKMFEFADKVGWRLSKEAEEGVERFCEELGVKRQVFKVWMHNNKNNNNNGKNQSTQGQGPLMEEDLKVNL